MGISWNCLRFLCRARQRGTDFTRTLTIGRQNLYVIPDKVRLALEACGLSPPPGCPPLGESGAYAEPLFAQLGAKVVDSLDASDYEGATHVCDLNGPAPAGLPGRYDVVFDGGTLEHVFHVPQALKNYMELVRVGGSVLIQTMANNWLGHGFYQFSPELFYRAFSPENGFRVERLVVAEAYEYGRAWEVPDPAAVRSRIELSNAWVGLDLLVHARRERDVPVFARPPQQSDYSAAWTDQSPAPGPGGAGGARRAARLLKGAFPGLAAGKHRFNQRYPALARALNRAGSRKYHQSHSTAAQPDKFRPTEL